MASDVCLMNLDFRATDDTSKKAEYFPVSDEEIFYISLAPVVSVIHICYSSLMIRHNKLMYVSLTAFAKPNNFEFE